MKEQLKSLSDQEIQILEGIHSNEGAIDPKRYDLSQEIFTKYELIQHNYYDLFNNCNDEEIKNECLKRLIFLTWFSQVEPPFLSGIDNLNTDIYFEYYKILDKKIASGKLDNEFIWMLSLYSNNAWSWSILDFTRNSLTALQEYIKSINENISYVPKGTMPKGSMDDRGSMGIYFKLRGVEITN